MGGTTALCPRCGIDSVIGDASGYPIADPAFLTAMRAYWFDRVAAVRTPLSIDGFVLQAILRDHDPADVARAPIEWRPENVTSTRFAIERTGRLREPCAIVRNGRTHQELRDGTLVLEAEGRWWFADLSEPGLEPTTGAD